MKVLLDLLESQILGDLMNGLKKKKLSSNENTQTQTLQPKNEKIDHQEQQVIISEKKWKILQEFFFRIKTI